MRWEAGSSNKRIGSNLTLACTKDRSILGGPDEAVKDCLYL